MSATGYQQMIDRMINRSRVFATKNSAYWAFLEVWRGRLRSEAWEAWKLGEGKKWFFVALMRTFVPPRQFW